MWMRVLPPSAYRNAEEKFAIAPLSPPVRGGVHNPTLTLTLALTQPYP